MQTISLAPPAQEPTTPVRKNASCNDIVDAEQPRGASHASSEYQHFIPQAVRLVPPASSAHAGSIIEISQHSSNYADNTYYQDENDNEDDDDNDYRPRLLKRFSTFWPSERELLEKRHSLEFLYPPPDCETRKSSPLVAIVGLVATVCGGGVLSLPIAFSKAGIMASTLLMLFAAVITEFSMYILCSCARRTGGRSYGDCMKKAFGPLAEIGATALLILLLIFVLIAYMVLVKDIATPMVLYVWPDLVTFFAKLGGLNPETQEDIVVDVASRYIPVVILLCVSPLLLKRDLHALRHTCYVGMASALFLLIGVVHRCVEVNMFQEPGLFREKVVWWGDTDGIMFAFPIIVLSFFSIYNVLSVHSSLTNPTRRRVKMVLDGTVCTCFGLFYIIGLAGYLYAYDETSDNILLNFPLSFRLILCGRVGYLFTLCFGLPLITLPCREATLSLPGQLRAWWTSSQVQSESRDDLSNKIENGTIKQNAGEKMKLLAKKQSFYSRYKATYEDDDSPRKNRNPPEDNYKNLPADEDEECCPDDSFEHRSSTLGLILLTYAVGISVPGVAVVWSVVGSSMALLIGFTIPSACYLKIRSRKRLNPRSLSAWLLLVFSVVASIVCTSQTLNRIQSGD